MSRLAETATSVQPDGKCHAVPAFVSGCAEPAVPGRWSCAVHAAQLQRRGAEIRAEVASKARKR